MFLCFVSDAFKTKDNNKQTTFDRNLGNNNKLQQNGNGESRELRFNRRNRDENRPAGGQQQTNNNSNNLCNGNAQEYNSNRDDRPPRRTGNDRGLDNRRDGGERREGGGGGPPRRPYGGKREFDRQSGSDKTGVKAVDKREGGGAHNWGTHKQDIEDLNKSNSDWEADKDANKEDGNGNANVSAGSAASKDGAAATAVGKEDASEATPAAEEEAKEITLEEWKAQRAVRAKPQFNIRKAGEGEDTSQWKKMVALNNRKKKVSFFFQINIFQLFVRN